MTQTTSDMIENPVLPPVATRMKIDLVVNEQGQTLVIYDRPLSEAVKWAEYDVARRKVTLCLLSGRMQELGLTIPHDMKDYLLRGRQLGLIRMKDKEIADIGLVPLMIQDYAVN